MIPSLKNEFEAPASARNAKLLVSKIINKQSTILNMIVYKSRYLPAELFKKHSNWRKLDTAKVEKKRT